MSNDQAYAVFGGSRANTADETNRLDTVIRSVINQMATMTLATVKAVNGQSVDIQPLVTQMDGAGNTVQHGTIHNAPVFRLQSGANAIIIDPQVGDIGLAIFAHNDISSAKRKKGAALPGSRRKFDWADAIYLGGVLNGTPTSFIQMLASGGINITGMGGNVVITSDQSIRFTTTGLVSTANAFAAGNGASGTAIDKNGKVLTFVNGILTSIA